MPGAAERLIVGGGVLKVGTEHCISEIGQTVPFPLTYHECTYCACEAIPSMSLSGGPIA